MNHITKRVRKEADDITSALKDATASVKTTLSKGGYKSIPKRINEPSGVNPVTMRRFLIAILKLLILLEFVAAIAEGMSGDWSRLGRDCILAGLLSIMWNRIRSYVLEQKDAYRQRMEQSHAEIKLLDAMMFSLLWSDEIYADIPEDQRRIAVIAYTLIAIGIGALYFGSDLSLLRLIVSASIVLAAVNLLAWVMSRERGEKESLQTELKLAHDVQVSLMPKEHPRITGFDIAGLSIPAKEVGGDHFDYSYLGDDTSQFCISVFDVSGKGMQAAMSAVFTTGLFASEVKQPRTAADILTRLNKPVWKHGQRGHFVAFLLAIIDVHAGTLTIANAGQVKPLLKSNGSVHALDASGAPFPLGMKEDTTYSERTLQLHPGDTVVMMTDGFTEAMNAGREQFGSERIERIVKDVDIRCSSQEMLNRITSDVGLHVGGATQHDDMTMVVVKVV